MCEFNKGHATVCGTCFKKYVDKYNSSLKGYLKNLLKSARGNVNRKAEHREEARVYDLVYDDILEVWERQDGLCYYSKIQMVTQPRSDYQASLERLDPDLGYIKENVVLCCLEFNHSAQWSVDKIIELFAIKDIESDDYMNVSFDLVKKPKKWSKLERKIIDGIQHVQCTVCRILKPVDEFYKAVNNGCKICADKKIKDNMNNPRPFVLHLIRETRSSTKYRNKKLTKQERQLDYDIDFDFIVNLYRQQKGRCAYSNVPIAFGSYREKNWIMSIERINPLLKPYRSLMVFIKVWIHLS